MNNQQESIINLDDLRDDGVQKTASQIQNAGSCITVAFSMPRTYRFSPIQEIVNSWLKAWYLAETLGALGTVRSYTMEEGDVGEALITIDIRADDPLAFATALHELAPALDQDDLEAELWLMDSASEWLEKRPTEASTDFPDLEKAYRDDAAELYL